MNPSTSGRAFARLVTASAAGRGTSGRHRAGLAAALLAALVLLAIAGDARAEVALHEFAPEEGTTGTALEVVLSGELGKGKPRLWLQLSGDTAKKPKKIPLKVGAPQPDGKVEGAVRLTAGFKNAKTGAGLHDLHVKRKGKGLADLVFTEVFTLRAPVVESVTPETAAPKDLVAVTGQFFGGPKKPTVFLAGTGKPKKAKVVGKVIVADGQYTAWVRVPKLPGGQHAVIVANKIGADALPAALEVIAPVKGGGKGGKVTLLHAFNGAGNGTLVVSRLLLAPDGNFYGTAWKGGPSDTGTIFRITPAGAFTLLHVMVSASDGEQPRKGLTLGPDGALYGVAQLGGPLGNGTIFRCTTEGEFSVVHAFGGAGSGGGPLGRLLLASDGNFYGTTSVGGTGTAANGTIFRLTPEGELTTLFVFRLFGEDSEFGILPSSALVEGPDGFLYGVAELGGTGCGTCGTVFRMSLEGDMTLVHTFTGANGSGPSGPLLVAADEWLYGVTALGGSSNMGTVYRISTEGQFQLVHSVNPQDNSVSVPEGSLVQTANGNLYGTGNVVIRLTPTLQFAPVYTFTDLIKQFGGAPAPLLPKGGMVVGPDGALYGTASSGGSASNHGAIFKVTLD